MTIVLQIIKLFGGLGMFLFGMNTMSSGLERAAGNKMQQIMEKVTGNLVKSVLLGAAVAALTQSSSATTVMVVGFVNAGILNLNQAVGIIMGANIGTTITAWILSLNDIPGGVWYLDIIKPTTLAPLALVIGAFILMFCSNKKKKVIGEFIIGLGILFIGMEYMAASMDVVFAEVPMLQNLFATDSNPMIGVLIGAGVTAIIQSSAASVGMLQAIASTGVLTFNAAFPIIMGQNIGTCVTALLSAIGANKNAKRAAMIHLYFNLIGTVVFMVLFYMINAAVHFPFMAQMATPATIAITHSVFNITATLVWLPFSNLLVKLACLTIRDDKVDEVSREDQEFMILESRFLEKPAFAVEQGRNAAKHMEQDSRKILDIALGLIYSYSDEQAERVQKLESKIDRYEDELGTYLVKLNNKDLSERDSHSVSIMLHCIGDFERISDHAVNIMESAQELHEKNISFSPQARNELQVLVAVVSRIVDTAYQVFDRQDLNLVSDVEPLEEIVDELSKELKRRHVNRLRLGECTIEMGFILTDLITSLERIADHCSNISVCVTQVRENLYDTHSHLESLKNEPDDSYYNRLGELHKEYVLP